MATNEYDVKYNKVEWAGALVLVFLCFAGCNTCNYIKHLDNVDTRKYEQTEQNDGTDIHSESILPR